MIRLSALLAVAALTACSPIRDNEALLGDEGASCESDRECGPTLACATNGECAEVGDPGTAGPRDPCTSDESCRFGLVCNGVGRCDDSETGSLGDRCQGSSGCEAPLVCDHGGSCVKPDADGTAADGESCEDDANCAFNLVCTSELLCGPLPLWSGVECDGDPLDGPPRVVFEVPRGTDDTDFYRLPYPNNARLSGGRLDLERYPGIGAGEEPGRTVGRYASALAETSDGFGPNAAVLFRFSAAVDYDSLEFSGDDPTFAFVDVTPGSDARGRRPRSRFFATTDRERYICHNWLGIRPSEGSALEAGHTYAVYFRTGLATSDGTLLEADGDFSALLSRTPPSHPALSAAWRRYQPFRGWLNQEGIPVDEIIGGTVFTVGNPQRFAEAMVSAVDVAPEIALEQPTLCDGGTASPCDAGGERVCGDLNPFFAEIHAKVKLPNYLQGMPPYVDWGGAILWEGDRPRLQRQEEVCVSVTVPLIEQPGGGYPVALFAHDAGGHFRTQVTRGLSARLARLGWATVSFDGVLQGPRSGGDSAPDAAATVALLENLDNVVLQRDQGLQALADLFAMARAIEGARLRTDQGTARLNRDKLVFFGHGRGAHAGMAFTAYDPRSIGAVFANPAAGMLDYLRQLQTPVNVGAELEIAFADPDLNGMHPGLHLMQAWLDPRDPVNYGRFLRQPPDGVTAKHVFMLYGAADPITPAAPMAHFAVAGRLERVGVEIDELKAIREVETSPAKGNVRTRDGVRTQVMKQYAGGDDFSGHDVVFESQPAIGDLNDFFRGLIEDDNGVPTIRD